jgi:hypothetical protein
MDDINTHITVSFEDRRWRVRRKGVVVGAYATAGIALSRAREISKKLIHQGQHVVLSRYRKDGRLADTRQFHPPVADARGHFQTGICEEA